MAVRVPASFPVTMTDIWSAVNDHTPTASKELGLCYYNSFSTYFDPAYDTTNQTMGRFRNYGPPQFYLSRMGSPITENGTTLTQFILQVTNGHVGDSYAFTLGGAGITIGDIEKMYINGVEVTPSLTGYFPLHLPVGTIYLPDGTTYNPSSYLQSFIWISAKADSLTEGTEILSCTLDVVGYTVYTDITDTSTTPVTTPIVTTGVVYTYTDTTISMISSLVYSEGGSPVTQRGICVSTSPNPTIDDDHTVDDYVVPTHYFNSYITNRIPNNTYHIRAYAINDSGVGYGADVSVTLDSIYLTLHSMSVGAITNLSIDFSYTLSNHTTRNYRPVVRFRNLTKSGSWNTTYYDTIYPGTDLLLTLPGANTSNINEIGDVMELFMSPNGDSFWGGTVVARTPIVLNYS